MAADHRDGGTFWMSMLDFSRIFIQIQVSKLSMRTGPGRTNNARRLADAARSAPSELGALADALRKSREDEDLRRACEASRPRKRARASEPDEEEALRRSRKTKEDEDVRRALEASRNNGQARGVIDLT